MNNGTPSSDVNEKEAPVTSGGSSPETDNNQGELSNIAGAGTSNIPLPNYDASIAFLQRFHPGRYWVLTAITLDKRSIKTETFDADSVPQCLAWLQAQGATRNLYFSVGEVARRVEKKAERTDIANVWWLHVDLDPGDDVANDQKRILSVLLASKGLPAPTVIVFSGGGYQAFWKLDKPIPIDCDLAKAEDAKRYNLQIEYVLDADNVHNIDRIMRIPGTLNRPDEKKIAKGRQLALARVVEWHDERVYSIGQFAKAPEVSAPAATLGKQRPVVIGNVKRLASVDELRGVSPKGRVVICQGHDPDEPNKFNGRSEWLFYGVCEMVRGGCDDDTIYSVITDPQFRISESVLDKGSMTDRYAQRQIARAREAGSDFETTDKGVPYPTQANVRRALHKLGVWVGYDEFADKLLITGMPEHRRPFLNDAATTQLWLKIDTLYRFRPAYDFFTKVVEVMARENSFHPVCDYLALLKWDGTPRVNRWLATYGGAEDSEFNQAVGALVLIAAVRRVRKPGCKFDEMLVLESPQGQGKSTAMRILASRDDWFTDDLPLNADTKRQIEALAGRWIVEAGELKGMRKGDVESLKGFLSRQVDSARVAYGRLPNDYPRQCVIIGSTNSEKYLKDDTGNRRFWPVKVGTFDNTALRRDRDQLWAEAAQREAQGEAIRLDPKFYVVAAAAQEDRLSDHPFYEMLEPIAGDPEFVGKLPTEDVWQILGKPTARDRSQDDCDKIGAVMRRLGWVRAQRRAVGERSYFYLKGTVAERAKLLKAEFVAGTWRIAEVPAPRGKDQQIPLPIPSSPF